MFRKFLVVLFTSGLISFSMACMSTTTSSLPVSALVGEPGDPGYPGPPGQITFRGKREVDVNQDILYFMTRETNFKQAEKLIQNERENLLSKLQSSEILYNTMSKELQQPIIFGSDGGYLISAINLEILQDWIMCYYFAEKVMLLNNEDSGKGIKMIVTCNGEQFY